MPHCLMFESYGQTRSVENAMKLAAARTKKQQSIAVVPIFIDFRGAITH